VSGNVERLSDNRAAHDRYDVTIDNITVLELHPSLRLAGGTEVLTGTGETKSGAEQFISGYGITKHHLNSQIRSSIPHTERQDAVPMIYDTWFDMIFNRNSEEELRQRALQAREQLHDDDDITDRTQEKLKASHISLGFTLDKVIKDLRHDNGHG